MLLLLLLVLAVAMAVTSGRLRRAAEQVSSLPPRGASPSAVPGASEACTASPGTALALATVVVGLRRPLLVAAPEGDSRLFIVEQEGLIHVLSDGRLLEEPFLDLRGEVELGNPEQGLLGLAFHPRFAANGRLFVHYSEARSGATVVAEYRVDPPDGDRVALPERRLEVDQPWGNHNGGHLAFGPDGYLYIGLGDGGSGGDPRGNGQNPRTLLGAMLRIDVDGELPYGIPPDNPFVGVDRARPELWAIGLRNPWRNCFVAGSGDLYIGDVGQRAVEEIDYQPARSRGGENYGWSVHEGSSCYGDHVDCGAPGFVSPVVDEPAAPPCNSITGGVVYRGACLPGLVGTYLYSDHCQDYVRSFVVRDGRAVDRRDWTAALDPGHRLLAGVASFGTDGAGEVYLVSHRNGVVYRLVVAP